MATEVHRIEDIIGTRPIYIYIYIDILVLFCIARRPHGVEKHQIYLILSHPSMPGKAHPNFITAYLGTLVCTVQAYIDIMNEFAITVTSDNLYFMSLRQIYLWVADDKRSSV